MIRFLLHSYGEFSSAMAMKPSVWPHFDLLFIHSGRMEMRIEGRGRVSLGEGEGVLLFPHTAFAPYGQQYRAKASVQHFSLDEDSVLPAPFDVLAGRSEAAIIRQGPRNLQLEADIERAMTLAVAEPSPMLSLMREALLTLILGEFLTKPLPDPSSDRRVATLMKWAEAQSLESLNVHRLAEKVHLTPSGLRRRFINEVQLTPSQFLLNLKMNEASRLLRETSLPVKEIARRLGYGSSVAFHAAFRKGKGETPSSYRKGHRTVG
ncbi:helix-turn-helix transcriptional regulator [Verrucomicrobiaceae bacterium N1E253]|uniref:Helix-turn-helix transcriptional regulator n=1 Tax=Oceaniferula marina TaxID=2748318 RepID=A0A851GIS7_9BACT|nr:helix-turn-helix domain-containing protein [Oceaniferula marina]NWK54124.1 helix-turn-helix transcriptional regulator [Oceaniferula marina]